MSASITRVVTVLITKGTRTVALATFNVPVILGPSNRFGDPYRVYSSTTSMTSDGFLPSDPEMIHAVALLSQPIKPNKWVVSKFTAAVAEVDTFAVGTLTASHAYAFTLNGTPITYTSAPSGDTQQSILAALLTAIGTAFPSNPPVTGAVTGTGSGALLTLTATVAGIGQSYTAIDASLTHVAVTPNHSVVQDLQTLQGVIAPADQFYGVLFTTKVVADQLQVAAYIETQLLTYLASTSDAGTLTSSTTDIGSMFKNFAYTRSWLLYQATAANAGDAAWMGYMLPTTPGIGNWSLKTLTGQTPDDQLNDTQLGFLTSKNVNFYVTIGGQGTTQNGIAPSGDYMDEVIFDDWLKSTMATNVFGYLVDPVNLKVPYLNSGITGIENQMRKALQQGQDNLGLAPGWTVFAPDAASVSSTDKKARTLNGMGFEAERGGAIGKVNIQGFVTQ